MIKDKLVEEIKEYCQLNGIEDVDRFVNKIVNKGFTLEKFGELKPKAKTEEEKAEEIGDDYNPTEEKEEKVEEEVEEVVQQEEVVEVPKPVKKVRVSPHAKKLIDKYDLDQELIEGTGKNGGITKKDVEKYLSENGIQKEQGNVVIKETIRQVKTKDIYDEDDVAQYGSNLLDNK